MTIPNPRVYATAEDHGFPPILGVTTLRRFSAAWFDQERQLLILFGGPLTRNAATQDTSEGEQDANSTP